MRLWVLSALIMAFIAELNSRSVQGTRRRTRSHPYFSNNCRRSHLRAGAISPMESVNPRMILIVRASRLAASVFARGLFFTVFVGCFAITPAPAARRGSGAAHTRSTDRGDPRLGEVRPAVQNGCRRPCPPNRATGRFSVIATLQERDPP